MLRRQRQQQHHQKRQGSSSSNSSSQDSSSKRGENSITGQHYHYHHHHHQQQQQQQQQQQLLILLFYWHRPVGVSNSCRRLTVVFNNNNTTSRRRSSQGTATAIWALPCKTVHELVSLIHQEAKEAASTIKCVEFAGCQHAWQTTPPTVIGNDDNNNNWQDIVLQTIYDSLGASLKHLIIHSGISDAQLAGFLHNQQGHHFPVLCRVDIHIQNTSLMVVDSSSLSLSGQHNNNNVTCTLQALVEREKSISSSLLINNDNHDDGGIIKVCHCRLQELCFWTDISNSSSSSTVVSSSSDSSSSLLSKSDSQALVQLLIHACNLRVLKLFPACRNNKQPVRTFDSNKSLIMVLHAVEEYGTCLENIVFPTVTDLMVSRQRHNGLTTTTSTTTASLHVESTGETNTGDHIDSSTGSATITHEGSHATRDAAAAAAADTTATATAAVPQQEIVVEEPHNQQQQQRGQEQEEQIQQPQPQTTNVAPQPYCNTTMVSVKQQQEHYQQLDFGQYLAFITCLHVVCRHLLLEQHQHHKVPCLYRCSVIENAFGIVEQWWRCTHRPITTTTIAAVVSEKPNHKNNNNNGNEVHENRLASGLGDSSTVAVSSSSSAADVAAAGRTNVNLPVFSTSGRQRVQHEALRRLLRYPSQQPRMSLQERLLRQQQQT